VAVSAQLSESRIDVAQMFFTEFRDLAARRSPMTFQLKNLFNLCERKADDLRLLYKCDAPYNVSRVKTVVRF